MESERRFCFPKILGSASGNLEGEVGLATKKMDFVEALVLRDCVLRATDGYEYQDYTAALLQRFRFPAFLYKSEERRSLDHDS